MWLNFGKSSFININDITHICCSSSSEKTGWGNDKKYVLYLTVEFRKNNDSFLTFYFEDSEEGFINRKNFLEDIYDALNFNSHILTVDCDKYGIIKRD